MHKRYTYTTDRHHKKPNEFQCTRDTQLIDIIKKLMNLSTEETDIQTTQPAHDTIKS